MIDDNPDTVSDERVLQSRELVAAIHEDDLDTVQRLVRQFPNLLHENARIGSRNWGPPLSYAANLGRDRIITMLRDHGATDIEYALERATLQGRIGTARMLHQWLGAPIPSTRSLDGPAYTLNVPGTALMFEFGVPVYNEVGTMTAPVATVLETDSRNPVAKHAILEMYVTHGALLPDTAPMAVHRGRIDLLEAHLARDPDLRTRTFTHDEIFPSALGCGDEVQATHGTPLNGATLLHMAVDYDEMEIAQWLLARGTPVDAKAAVDVDGFGGHTALFATVVSQPNFWMNYQDRAQVAPFAQLLLEHGANPQLRASLRKQLHPGYDGTHVLREYRDVTPLEWGERFEARVFVSMPAMQLITARM